ncbi:MAG: hypothetical protein PF448_08760 [Bacteroidales bacterium]|jgi:hypothetical protein|nr:hypothetical protein [Bacteroidales bacterium]
MNKINFKIKKPVRFAILAILAVFVIALIASPKFRDKIKQILHDLLFNPLGFDPFGMAESSTDNNDNGDNSDDESGGDDDTINPGDNWGDAGEQTPCDPDLIVSEYYVGETLVHENECGGIVVFAN